MVGTVPGRRSRDHASDAVKQNAPRLPMLHRMPGEQNSVGIPQLPSRPFRKSADLTGFARYRPEP